ncbi:peptide-methionine (S)-S-oxide reductase MsrA [Dehalogenimonas etheniformans]|uniref:Peptide methionine sulfoxide reductase MsrA n=1 Tax=Dehalogenimonas etheniformans TaxID=1536648 RepID=A0A2P5P5Z3_9CHLR|nr:peptide-methionine (S)-S-oxide reductase MsrA [Dehalogenimonas etheniformans]PPD57723.1 peptide-methionine (S)-S-oxide reductase [Dehalogenimonas etheniformans]QNT76063.1 peptide-methionine (S)-S-oxide reductase MsrA [Dehalogenimonas etheniformans]
MTESAVLGGGCFWCIQAIFSRLKGVSRVTSGYAGGTAPSPTYEQVCAGRTGHAEVVKIDFDPAVISYHDLLQVFFKAHDPTTLNRQGADLGTQYRSVILYSSEAQKNAAGNYIAQLVKDKAFPQPIVTEVKQLEAFYPAEAYHQDYYQLHPEKGYCQAVIAPKLAKLFKS